MIHLHVWRIFRAHNMTNGQICAYQTIDRHRSPGIIIHESLVCMINAPSILIEIT